VSQDGDMVRRTRTPLSIICLALGLTVLLGAGQPRESGSAIANGPAALGGGAAVEVEASEEGVEHPPPSDDADAEPLAVSPPPDSSADTKTAPPLVDRESRALGEPNGPFSARPVGESAQSPGVPERNPLAKLDPRRNEFVRVFGALAVVLGLLILLRLFLRRASGLLSGGGRPSGVLEILARYPIGRGQSLMILKMARRVLLVHQAGSSMNTLTEVTGEGEVAALLARMEAGARTRDVVRFRNALRKFEHEHDRLASRRFPPGGESDIERAEIVDLTRRRTRPAFPGRGRKVQA
jgi:flagellar biogenesis protein FliO